MAKKKMTDVTEPISGRHIAADSVLAQTVREVEVKMGKAGMLVGHDAAIHVLPMPSIALRYLIQNEGFPLSRCYQLVGESASYKSTFAAEIIRWHRICGGAGILYEAETKPTPDLRNSVLNWDEAAVHVEECNTIEEWQAKNTWYTMRLQKNLGAAGGAGRTLPYCFVVDSLTGKPAQKTLDNMIERGSASMHFAVEARLISDYYKAYPSYITGWPFTFVGVNHLKVAKDMQTGLVNYNVPGGAALKFHCAMIMELGRMGAVKEFSNYKVATIYMKMFKNSYGPEGPQIHVRFKTWTSEDAPGVTRLHSRFEWWEASIFLLGAGVGMKKAQSDMLLPKIKEICDIHEKAAGSLGKLWWSKRLGVESSDAMPAHDLGVILESRPDVLADLYTVLGIQRRPFFRPGVDYMNQLEEYQHVVRQADAADDALKLAAALRDNAQVGMGMPAAAVEEETEYD